MKKTIFRIFAAALALMLLGALALAEVRTTGNVWMRTGPGLSYEAVTSFSKGKSLEYLGETSVDNRGVAWYKVSSGKYTGWVSSRYSELRGEESNVVNVEPTATPVPAATATPQSTATPEPTATPKPVSLPALDAGALFSDIVSGANPESADETPEDVNGTPEEADDPQQTVALPAPVAELSQYYRQDLVTAANEIGLISYRQVVSEAPYQYYDDAVILAGNQTVENIVVYGEGYEVFGVRVGMNANAAMACMNAAGLDFVASENGMTYLHRAAADSPYFVNEEGYDSNINLWVDDENVVTQIDWSTFTG